jgi:hypothetical protein
MAQLMRLLGSRYILAFGLVLGIGVVIAIGKVLGGTAQPAGVTAHAPSPVPTVIASGQEDDGVDAPESPPGPSTSAGASAPQKVATQFLTAWLKHTDVTAEGWYAGLRRYMTAKLADELTGVDPAGVPATKVTGRVMLIDHAPNFVEASIPVDSGTVTLRLLATDGRWLVDGVDWTRT